VLAPISVDRGPLGETRQTDVGVSLGVAQAPLCGTTDSAIMRAADEALYAAKELGRGRAVFAEDTRRPTEPAEEEAQVA
jgi:predicted signal transduction protein with EAL and GGDEF domain